MIPLPRSARLARAYPCRFLRAIGLVIALSACGGRLGYFVEAAEPVPAAFSIAAVLRDEQALAGAHDVEVRDGYAYTAGKGGSLAIIDVRRPNAPHIVWSICDPKEYEDAETVLPLGERLLVGSRDLMLFDVTRPSQPERKALLHDRERIDRINGVVRIGDTIVGANKEGFLVVVRWDGADGLQFLGARATAEDGLISPHDLDVVGRRLIVADGNGFGRDNRPGRVAAYQFRDTAESAPWPPEKWKLVGKAEDVRLAGCNRVRTYGSLAIAACSVSPKAAGQPGRKGSLQVIDFADPAAPRICGSIEFADTRGANGLTLAGGVAFVCGGRTVAAVGLADRDRPQLLGSIDLTKVLPGGDDDLHDADYADGRLYVTAQTSHALVVLKVEDPKILAAAARP